MHILYIHQYFKTPEEGGCIRSHHIAIGMIKAGHQVTVISGANFEEIKQIGSLEIRYLNIPYRNEYGFFRRVWAFLLFVVKAKTEIKKIKPVDMAYVVTTPLTTGIIALHLKEKFGIPYAFEVGDLWPEAPIQLGVVKNRGLIKLLRRFEKSCYENASRVVALSPPIAEHILKVVPNCKIEIIPNFSDSDLFASEPTTPTSTFNIGYFGTFGRANRLIEILEIAEKSQKENLNVSFHLMGEGAEKDSLLKRSSNLKNVTFYPMGSQFEVSTQMKKMQAIIVCFDQRIPILSSGSPNKFFDGLAGGKLIIHNLDGWIKDLVEKHQCGFYFNSYENFGEKLRPYLADPQKILIDQQNAKKLSEVFDKQKQVNKLLAFFAD